MIVLFDIRLMSHEGGLFLGIRIYAFGGIFTEKLKQQVTKKGEWQVAKGYCSSTGFSVLLS